MAINTLNISKGLGDLYKVTLDNFQTQVRIEANTLRTANNTDRLAAMEGSLTKIAANTSAGSSYQNLLNGGVKP